MADSFEESIRNARENHGLGLSAGDECPEDCDVTLHELHHPRNSQLSDATRHPDAPEREVVCRHHGVLEAE